MAPVNEVDFSNLSDEELSQMLVDYGVDVGPVNDATRRVYERKLARLKTGQPSPHSYKYEPIDDDEEEEDDDVVGAFENNDDSEIQFRRPDVDRPTSYRQPSSGHTPSREVLDPPQARLRRDVDYTNTPRVEPRQGLSSYKRTTHTETRPAARVDKAQTGSSSKGLPMWVKLMAFLVVVVMVYLIYSNMEPQAVSNIPGIPSKVEV